jgi:hypothetical protein
MTPNESETVTPTDAEQAWRDDYRSMSEAELDALIHPDRWFHDHIAGVLVRVTGEPTRTTEDGPLRVPGEDWNGQRVEHDLADVRAYITTGEFEPIPQAVVENAEQIVLDVANHHLGQLATLSRDAEYGVSEHTETYADARNAVWIAGMDGFGGGEDT